MAETEAVSVAIATAPCCWGVDDPTRTDLPSWERVLDEAAAAGYAGLELGPYGYMPLDVATLAPALSARGLQIVAGTIFDDLVSPGNRAGLVRQAEEICALLAALPRPGPLPGQRHPAPYLTVMDWGHEARDYAAGHSDRARRLPDAAWAGMVANVHAVCEVAAAHGVRPVLHPHAGGHIEFADEIDRLLTDVPDDLAGLCLDTGHAWYAGMDPVAALERHARRLDYVHLKDIDRAVFDQVMAERVRFFDACARGVMCPIGRGAIDYPAIREALARISYGGFATVEQEREPSSVGGSLGDVRASLGYLEQIGFQKGRIP